MGVAERKEREKLELRQLILEAATKTFIEEGFEKTSIRGIAEQIEYSPATIYLHFKDKNELFHEIHTQGFEKFFEKLQEAQVVENPLERLRKMGDLYIEFAFENPEYYDLMFILKAPMEALHHEEPWEHGFKTYNLLKDTVQECFDQDCIRGVNVEIMSMTIMSFMHGMTSLAIRKRFKMFPEEQLREIFKSALDNIIDITQKTKEDLI